MKSVPFTAEFNTNTGSIVTDCKVCKAHDVSITPWRTHPPYHPFKAIWDTGAMHSSISTEVAQQLGITPFSFATIPFTAAKINPPRHTEITEKFYRFPRTVVLLFEGFMNAPIKLFLNATHRVCLGTIVGASIC